MSSLLLGIHFSATLGVFIQGAQQFLQVVLRVGRAQHFVHVGHGRHDNGIGYGGVDDGTHDPSAKESDTQDIWEDDVVIQKNNLWDE